MTARDRLAEALDSATRAMDAAIALAKELGQLEARDTLIGVREDWTRKGYRACKGMAARGRIAARPIVPASYSLSPLRGPRPALRVVPCEPSYREIVEDMRREAERQARASKKLLEQAEAEAPYAG